MNEEKYLFNKNCFLPAWGIDDVEPNFPDEDEEEQPAATEQQPEEEQTPAVFIPHRKSLATLLAELEEIKNSIEDIKARQWHLAKLMKFHKEGFARG